MTSEHIALRKAAEMALEAWDDPQGMPKLCKALDEMREAIAHGNRKCEAGPSLQDLWNCWDAVHGGEQEPEVDYEISIHKEMPGVRAAIRFVPIPEGWQLMPIEPTKDMSDVFWSAYIPAPDGIAQSCSFEDFHDFRYMYKAMLAAAPKYEEQSK